MKTYYAMQVCCYSEMLEALQGRSPEHAGIILGARERKPLRVSDYYFYYRAIKRAFLEQQRAFRPDAPRDFPGRADYRHWTGYVTGLLEARNDVSLVANIRRAQVEKLAEAGITTVKGLAESSLELVPRMARDTFERLKSQARLQLSSIPGKPPAYEVLPECVENRRRGFGLLPPPSPNDIAFDILTHAGFTRRWLKKFSKPLMERYLEEVFQALLKGESHPLLGIGTDRGGDNEIGGVTWCDWRYFGPIAGIPQIVGHTPDQQVRWAGFERRASGEYNLEHCVAGEFDEEAEVAVEDELSLCLDRI